MMLESPSNVIWQVYLWSTLIPLVLNFGNLLLSRWIPAERGVGLSGNDVFLSPWHSDPNSAQSAEICSHTIELQFSPATRNFASTMLHMYRYCLHPQ